MSVSDELTLEVGAWLGDRDAEALPTIGTLRHILTLDSKVLYQKSMQ
jgi:hypothetical protein